MTQGYNSWKLEITKSLPNIDKNTIQNRLRESDYYRSKIEMKKRYELECLIFEPFDGNSKYRNKRELRYDVDSYVKSNKLPKKTNIMGIVGGMLSFIILVSIIVPIALKFKRINEKLKNKQNNN